MPGWWLMLGVVTVIAEGSQLQAELGMRSKRRPSESDRVTIDLSALRPSLPGLVLYKYGELAPKLVQVDLSALNPRLQPHVIWPQFSEVDPLEERPFEMDNLDAIPYLTEEDTLLYNGPKQQRTARMSGHWLDGGARNDMYDFVSDSVPQDKLLSLHGSLPIADEVIVPLDWEEQDAKKKGVEKRNVFLTRGWRAGGERENRGPQTLSGVRKVSMPNLNSYYLTRSLPERRPARRRERESEDNLPTREADPGQSPPTSAALGARGPQEPVEEARVPSQESWSVPRQYWTVPHLFVNNWQ